MEFYDFLFPDTRQLAPKSHQDTFTEYGCLEAINLECDETERKFDVTIKKEKHLHQLLDDKVHNAYMPIQGLLPFGKPHRIDKFIPKLSMHDLCQDRRLTGNRGTSNSDVVTNVESQIHNLLTDHPDAYHGTFLQMFSHHFPYQVSNNCGYNIIGDINISQNAKKSSCPSKPSAKHGNAVFQNLQPDLCDIPRSVLSEYILEEIAHQTHVMEYNEAYSGGCIEYVDVCTSGSNRCGILFYPQGNAMDCLEFQLVDMQTPQESRSEDMYDYLVPGSSYRIKVNGTILQTNSISPLTSPEMCLFGARTHYSVLLSSMDKTNLWSSETEQTSPRFSTDECIRVYGGFQSTSTISSIALNPFLAGECVLALHNGCVYQWDSVVYPSTDNQTNHSQGLQKVNVQCDYGKDSWRQVAFGAHPRQIYSASRFGVNVIDMRTKSVSPSRVLYSDDDNKDKVMAILPASRYQCVDPISNAHSDFQCVVATQFHLSLHDQRYTKAPLLKWSLAMRKPCQHLSGVAFHQQDEDLSLLLAANQHPQQIQCFQYKCSLKKTPVSISPIRALSSAAEIRRCISQLSIPRFQSYVESRLNQPVIGITTVSHGNHAAVLQISDCGDVFYQMLRLTDATQESDACSTATGLESAMYYTEKLHVREKAAEQVYKEWAGVVASQHNEEPGCNFGGACINATKLSPYLLSNKVGEFIRKQIKADLQDTLEENCLICPNACFMHKEGAGSQPVVKTEKEEHFDNQGTDTTPPTLCTQCGNSKQFNKGIVHSHKEGVYPASRNGINDVQTDATVDCESEVPDLNLINTERAKDLGMVLVSTWHGSYEDLWHKLEQRKLKEQKEDERKAALSVLDLPGETLDRDSNIKHWQSGQADFPKCDNENHNVTSDGDYESALLSATNTAKLPFVPLVRLPSEIEEGAAMILSTDIHSPVRKELKSSKLNSPLNRSQNTKRRRKTMIGFS